MKAYAQAPNSIRGIEIFAVGKHNGDEYVSADLDDMVSAFADLDFRPAVKIGHTADKPGAPAYGWITNLRRAGDKLIADFESMHDTVISAIREKSYNAVSSEIYFNLKRGGKTFRRALKAVALLGAEVPAVAGLVPLHKMEFAADGEFEKVFATESPLEVSAQAMFECLSERMASIINLSETDMKTKAEQLKELNDKLDAVNVKLLALAGTTDKDKDAAIKKLAEDMTAIRGEIKTLSESSDDADANTRELARQKAEKEETEKRFKAQADQIEELRADARRREVASKVAALKVPAFRPALEALFAYALTHNAEKVKVYSKDKDGKEVPVEKTLADIADGIVADINAQATKLFATLAGSNTPREEGSDNPDNPGAEVDKRAHALIADKKAKTYMEAVESVMAADPALAKAYNEQTSARATAH